MLLPHFTLLGLSFAGLKRLIYRALNGLLSLPFAKPDSMVYKLLFSPKHVNQKREIG